MTTVKSSKNNTAALQRWKILAGVVKRDSVTSCGPKGCTVETGSEVFDKFSSISVRRFGGFQLFQTVKLPVSAEEEQNLQEKGYEWFEFNCKVPPQFDFALLVRQRTRNVKIEDLGGFDNTGNICIWPAEEVLAYYVKKDALMFSGKAICEIGAGMTALAGLVLAVSSNATEVFVTDGNEDAVANIEIVIKKNKALFGKTKVYERCLKWGVHKTYQDLEGRFDCLICADCFVFTKCHRSLLETMNILLKPQGCVIAFAPRRKNSLEQFCETAKLWFNVEICDFYDDLVWTKHQEAKAKGESFYSEDIHYPLLIKLHRKITR